MSSVFGARKAVKSSIAPSDNNSVKGKTSKNLSEKSFIRFTMTVNKSQFFAPTANDCIIREPLKNQNWGSATFGGVTENPVVPKTEISPHFPEGCGMDKKHDDVGRKATLSDSDGFMQTIMKELNPRFFVFADETDDEES